jgi:hypothetical protein
VPPNPYANRYNVHPQRRILQQNPPARWARPLAEVTGMRVLRRGRLSGLIHEHEQAA